jgi:hypothetical protein
MSIASLMRQKEVRSIISAENLRGSWQRAAREFTEGKDLMHYWLAAISDAMQLPAMVATIQFEPILPKE